MVNMGGLSPAELAYWESRMGASPEEKIASIRNLLRHAAEDRMSKDDREICKTTLLRLEAERDQRTVTA